MNEEVRDELSKRPSGILLIGWAVVIAIVVIGLFAQFVIMKRAMGIDAEKQLLVGQKAQANQQLDETKGEIQNASKVLAEYRPQVDSLTNQRNELQGQVNEFEKSIETQRVRFTEFAIKLENAEKDEQKAIEGQKKAEEKLAELAGKIKVMEEQLAAITSDLATKTERRSALALEVNTLQHQTIKLEDINTQIEENELKNSELTAKQSLLESKVAEQRNENAKLVTEYREATRLLDLAKSNTLALEAKAGLLDAEVTSLESKKYTLTSVEEDLVQAKSELSKIESKTQRLVNQYGSASTLVDMLSSLRTELGAVNEQLSAAERRVTELNGVEADIKKANSSLRDLKREVGGEESRLTEVDNQISDRRKELATLEEKILSAQRRLQQSVQADVQ